MSKYILKFVVFVLVVAGIWTAACLLERATGIPCEFWMETVCVTHIGLNISEDILGEKHKH